MTNKCILVVDDEPSVRTLLAAVLKQFGFRVRLASSGEEAVKVFARDPGGIDLVLLDVRMHEMDGPETLFALRGLDPRVRCCFMSGHAGGHGDQDLLALGAAHVFSKPFSSLGELTRTLVHVVGAA